jgi:hypothetical protein
MKFELSYRITYLAGESNKEEEHFSVLVMDFVNDELGLEYLRERVQQIVNDLESNGHDFVRSEEEIRAAYDEF